MRPSVYTLNHKTSKTEYDRLSKQHYILVSLLDLLPKEAHDHLLSRPTPPAVVDIGTGTGIWLADLAATLPSDARLDGLDFDTSKFCCASTLPPNVSLNFADILEPFPEKWFGQYDCVHVRLLMFALKAVEWEQVLANLKLLLRPGGYLVWEDVGYPDWLCVPMTTNFQKWVDVDSRYAVSVGRDPIFPRGFLDRVKNQGYVNCREMTFNSLVASDSIKHGISCVQIAVARQSLHGIVEKGGFDWLKTPQDAEDLANALVKDYENGTSIQGANFHRIIAQL